MLGERLQNTRQRVKESSLKRWDDRLTLVRENRENATQIADSGVPRLQDLDKRLDLFKQQIRFSSKANQQKVVSYSQND